MCAACPAPHHAVIKSQVLSLDTQQRLLEAELCQKTKDLEVASAQNAELAEQVQFFNNTMEERCALAVRASEQKLRQLQVGLQLHPTSFLRLLMLVFP